jgi:hypothetical protein
MKEEIRNFKIQIDKKIEAFLYHFNFQIKVLQNIYLSI